MSLIASAIDPNTVLLVTALTLLFKFILDKFGPDPRFRKIDSQIPGPFRWPIIGNSLSFILAGKEGQNELHEEMIKKYGRIYRTWIGNNFIVQLSHPDDLKAIATNTKVLGKGQIIWPINNILGEGLFSAMSIPFWKKSRKRLQPFFTKDITKELVPHFNELIYKVVNKLEKNVDGPAIEVSDMFHNLSLDFLTSTAYDFEISQNEKLVNEYNHKMQKLVNVVSLRTFLPLLNTGVFRLVIDKLFAEPMKKFCRNLTKKVISKRVSAIQNGTYDFNRGHFSSNLFLSSYNIGNEIGEKHMLDEIFTLMFAAGETTMRTITFSLLMIAMNPEIQFKVYNQIQEVFGDDDRKADLRDCDQLTFLKRVIKETLRRFTLIPFLFRKTEEDIQIGQYTFPAGTEFMINVAGIHFNPEFYPNPQEFNPENFTDEAIKKRHKYSYLPFGVGGRICIGKNVAEIEVLLVLVAILRAYSVHTGITMEDLKIAFGLVIKNKDGIWLSFKKRKSK